MSDIGIGVLIGAALAMIVLVPMLQDKERRITNLLSDLDALEDMRNRDNFFAEQESNLDLMIERHRR